MGKQRHIEVNQLWLQERVNSKQIEIEKVTTDENIADPMTKFKENESIRLCMSRVNSEIRNERHPIMPKLKEGENDIKLEEASEDGDMLGCIDDVDVNRPPCTCQAQNLSSLYCFLSRQPSKVNLGETMSSPGADVKADPPVAKRVEEIENKKRGPMPEFKLEDQPPRGLLTAGMLNSLSKDEELKSEDPRTKDEIEAMLLAKQEEKKKLISCGFKRELTPNKLRSRK